VPGRDREVSEAGRVVRLPDDARDEDLHQLADGQEGARGRHGVPAGQSPARLPNLRPGILFEQTGSSKHNTSLGGTTSARGGDIKRKDERCGQAGATADARAKEEARWCIEGDQL